MIYAMSDIHGCLAQLKEKTDLIDLSGANKLVLLGDYIDYGSESGQVLRYLYDLQREFGPEKVIVLKGNHEAMLLEWIGDFQKKYTPEMEALVYDSWLKTDSERQGYGLDKLIDDLVYDSWLKTDSECYYNTFRTMVTKEQLLELEQVGHSASFVELNRMAANMILETSGELISWIRNMNSFYQTDTQIFVHAGVDEEAGEYWEWGSSDGSFLWKYPASTGPFYKEVIAGHVGTDNLAKDRSYHEIYHDGESHYYIDGSVYDKGKLLLLGYDEKTGIYYQVESSGMVPVKKYSGNR